MTRQLINLAKINFAGNSGAAPGPTPPGPTPPGPSPTPSADAGVVLRDYDGSVVASYTAEEFAVLTEMPTPPAHEGLTFQEWNYSLEDAKTYVAAYGMLNIGASYITSDGKTRIYITLNEGRTSPYLGFAVNGSVDVDWGDGSAHDTVTGTSLSTLINTQHVYAAPGDYVIALTPAEGTSIGLIGSSSIGCQLLWNNENTANSPNRAYQGSIIEVRIGVGVMTIGPYAFSTCLHLQTITLGGIPRIEPRTFNYCFDLAYVVIPKTVTSIDIYAFYSALGLRGISISSAVTSIGQNAFEQCQLLESIELPEGISTIDRILYNCFALKKVVIPSSVKSITNAFLQNHYNLESVVLAEGLEAISVSALADCYSLRKIVLPSTLTIIPSYFSQDCLSLESVEIKNGTTTIQQNAFENCRSLKSLKLPSTLKRIGMFAFNVCESLEEVILPEGLEYIDSYAFQNNKRLKHATIPSTVVDIATNMFASCYSLEKVHIEEGVRLIGSSMFQYCYNLTEITIPSTVTAVLSNAFNGCFSLKLYKFKPTTPPTIQSNTFNSIPADAIIYVPAESVDAYKAATNWSAQASKIQPMLND